MPMRHETAGGVLDLSKRSGRDGAGGCEDTLARSTEDRRLSEVLGLPIHGIAPVQCNPSGR